MTELTQKLGLLMDQVDQRSGGWISILRQSFARFYELNGANSAASLAYYALFSLFPLTLLFVALLGTVVKSEVALRQAVIIIRLLFPFSGDLVEQNMSEVLNQHATIGVVGLIGLLWSASGYFNTLANGVNLAWPKIKLRGFVHNRMIALGMMSILILLLLLSLISSTLINLLPYLTRWIGVEVALPAPGGWLSALRLVPALFTFLMFTGIFQWVPNKHVRWKAVLVVALVTTVAWELAKWIFTMYLSSGLARYEFVYGSLSTLIALMVWIYLSNLIALFGAYMVAAYDMRLEFGNVNRPLETRVATEMPKGIHG